MRIFAVVLFLFSACTFVRSEPTGRHTIRKGEPSAIDAGLDPREQLDGLTRYLAQQGYTHVGKVLLNRAFAAPQTIVHDFQLGTGQCYVAVGITESSSDLNLTVLGPNGRAVGHDVRRDSHPSVRFCPRAAGRYSARLQMARGSGGYYLALFEGPSNVNPQVARYFTQPQPGDGAVREARIDRTTQARVNVLEKNLRREGYSSVGPVQGLALGGTRSRDFRLNLKPGRCYVFATFAGPGVLEANSTILTDDDEEIERDDDEARDSILRFCPPHADDFTLRAGILSGEGAVFVAGWQRDVDGASPNGGGDGHTVIDGASTESASLEEAFALRSADLVARGYVALGAPTQSEIPPGSQKRYAFALEAGKCYAALAVGGQSVASMRLTAEAREGGILDRDIDGGRATVVRFCTGASPGQKYITVDMAHGGGAVMLGAFVWPRGSQGPFGLEGVMYVRLAEMMQLLELEGYEPSMLFAPERGTFEREGVKRSHHIKLEGGRCYALVSVGDEHITDLGLQLRQDARVLAADLSHNAFPSVRHCADTDVELDVEVTAKRGRGDYFYQLFERSRD